MANYLHDFSKIVKSGHARFEGLAKALEIEDVKAWRKSELYTETILNLRKGLKETRFTKIRDILDFIGEYITEDTLNLYRIDAGMSLLENFDTNKDLIKTIMNRFDKDLRKINKTILEPFGINIKITRRSTQWETYESISDIMPSDVTRNSNTHYGRDDDQRTNRPYWNVEITFPLDLFEVRLNNTTSCMIPMEIMQPRDDNRERLKINVHYYFHSMVEMFVTNSDKINLWSKKPEEFKEAMLKNMDRNHSMSSNIRINYYSPHPYKSDSGTWCYGTFEPVIRRAFKEMNLLQLAIKLKEWFMSYDLTQANPHQRLNTFYDWLPSTIENAHLLPHSREQARNCWSSIDDDRSNLPAHQRQVSNHSTCDARQCVFIDDCIMYQNEPVVNEEQTFNTVSDETIATIEIDQIGQSYYSGAHERFVPLQPGTYLSLTGYEVQQMWARRLLDISALSLGAQQDLYRELHHIRSTFTTYLDENNISLSDINQAADLALLNDFFRNYRSELANVCELLDRWSLFELFQYQRYLNSLLSERVMESAGIRINRNDIPDDLERLNNSPRVSV